MTDIMKKLTGVKNICCVLLIIKRGEIMGAAIQKVMVNYKNLLNSKKEKELFCAILTHCDPHTSFDGNNSILEEIDDMV
jgi:hypothetical protein